MKPAPRRRSTGERILDVAEGLVQTRGFNGFSYADLSKTLHIEKASIHYHFPTKGDLGMRLVARYHERFQGALAEIEGSSRDPRTILRRYVALWRGVLRDRNRMCLCGMLAAEVETLPKAVRQGLKAFFDANESWLAGVLAAGRKAERFGFPGTPLAEARTLLMGLEGAMLLARSFGEPDRFDECAERLLARLGSGA